MSAINSKWLRFGTLGLLYFVQGAPYGFQTACLPLILRQAGLSFTELGAMKLLFLPWICKPLYAPFVERTKSKKWWLIFSMTLLGFTCLMAGSFVQIGNLLALSVLLFVLNLLAATQDISVDSLAVHALEPEELGAGNTIQVVGYKFGSVVAGGFLLWVDQILGWHVMFICFSMIYFVSVFLLCQLNLVERSSSKETNKSDENHNEEPPSLLSAFKVPGTLWMVSFVLFYKLCERAEQTFSLFMVDKKVPMAQLAFWSTVMRIGSLFGSTYGGWALSGRLDQIPPQKIILNFSLIRSFSIGCQLVLVFVWGEVPITSVDPFTFDWACIHLSFLLLCITLFSAGAITTATFTLMMRLSQTAPSSLQGTHYTVLATCEVFGKLVFAIFAGWLTDVFGLKIIYFIFVTLAVLNVPFILRRPASITKLCKTN